MNGIPWEGGLRGKGVQASWLCFKEALLREQEPAIPMQWKTVKCNRRPAGLDGDHFKELKLKTKSCKNWKCGYIAKEECKNSAWMFREKVRKVKGQAKRQLAMDMTCL